ncbi:15822_t:CDS:1, partial [Dentiscutata erythropus]
EDVNKSLVKDQLNEDINELQIESLSDLKNDIKRLSLSIEHFHDFTIKDKQKKILVKSFNCYLEKEIDPLCNNNLEINNLQRKNLANLFNHLHHFNYNAHLKEIKMQAVNLGLFYINQRNIIGNKTFRKVIKKKENWLEENKHWIKNFVFFIKETLMNKC